MAGLTRAIDRLQREDGLAERLRAGGRRTAVSMPVDAVVNQVEDLLAAVAPVSTAAAP